MIAFLAIIGGLVVIAVGLILLYWAIDLLVRFVLSVIMVRQWRREAQR